ncbi:MAG: alpha/beta hydrolase [Pseudomonadota bacterium]
MIDWTDAFENGAYIEGSAALRDIWQAEAAAFRDNWPTQTLGAAYGSAPRQCYDLFQTETQRGTVIFVHGGYWHQTDRSWWSHLAAGPLAHGWSVAMPSYTLAPEARISQITAEIAQAVCAIAAAQPGPIRLTGHSAGGHLASRMAVAGVLPDAVRARVELTVSISGVHHLEPLKASKMNEILQLDAHEAEAESPALQDPAEGTNILFWVGAGERPEFLRQNRMIAEAWSRKGADVSEQYDAGENHFSVVGKLADPDSPLVKSLCS